MHRTTTTKLSWCNGGRVLCENKKTIVLKKLSKRNNECFCGNTLSYPTQTTTCTQKCPGNNAEFCGGNNNGWYANVYSRGYPSKNI